MSEPEITVKKMTHYQSVQLLGLDEQGRQLYVCPSAGCGDTAYFDEEGRGHCPSDEAMSSALRTLLSDAVEGTVPEWAKGKPA
jgi:hypothetical protein